MEDNALSWYDLDQHYIDRFRLEESGRCYAINYTADPVTDIYRKIYYSYPCEQRKGYEAIDRTIKPTVTCDDLRKANHECYRRMNDSEDQYAIQPKPIGWTLYMEHYKPFELNIHSSNLPK
jgi:hypothetical protein